jgi:hypothetical protein
MLIVIVGIIRQTAGSRQKAAGTGQQTADSIADLGWSLILACFSSLVCCRSIRDISFYIQQPWTLQHLEYIEDALRMLQGCCAFGVVLLLQLPRCD